MNIDDNNAYKKYLFPCRYTVVKLFFLYHRVMEYKYDDFRIKMLITTCTYVRTGNGKKIEEM